MANAGCDDRDRGLYAKFRVWRTDGRSEPGEKHHNCNLFVLDLDHDPHALRAATLYAQDCTVTHPRLSADLIALIQTIAVAQLRAREEPK